MSAPHKNCPVIIPKYSVCVVKNDSVEQVIFNKPLKECVLEFRPIYLHDW